MHPLILRVPLTHFTGVGAPPPLTRTSAIDLARHASGEAPREVHLVVTVDHEDDGIPLELATVELNSAPGGGWRLQYVSHSAQSLGLTAQVAPDASDFEAFIQVRKNAGLLCDFAPCTAQEMEDEGLGPRPRSTSSAINTR